MDIKESIKKMIRVLLVASKPDKEEFKQSSKITGAGILIIGLIGFSIFMVAMFLSGIV